jgi:hypothetical protein
MLIQTQAGVPGRQTSGTFPTAPGGTFGELLDSKLLPDYYSLVKAGLVYAVSAAAINPSAFVGGAAGTPIFGIYNPQNSGKDVVLLDLSVAIRTTGTAAVATDFNHWAVAQGTTAVTGTATAATNMYSLAATGSAVRAMVNTANTAALASSLIRPAMSVGLTAATAVTNVQFLRDEIKGAVVIAPGSYYAFGLSVALTAASIDAGLLWAEIPV